MDEDEDEEYEAGYVLATIRHREPFHQSKEWCMVHVFVDNCADDHVCSPRDLEWIAVEPSRNPNLVSARGHELKHNGEQTEPMKLRDGRIMSVGKFCTKGNDRCTTFTTSGGTVWHEEAGEIVVDRVRNLNELECWIKPGNVLAPVQIGGSGGSANLRDGTLQSHNEQTPEILMDAQPHGVYAPRADEEYNELEILPQRRHQDHPSPAKRKLRNTTCA